MAAVNIDRVTKRFDAHTAIDELSLACEDGEFVALLGPSGCGKTTMLRMLAGFDTPCEGTIRLNERILFDAEHQVPPEQRDMAMVFQSYALWPHMSVADNVGYPLKVRGVNRAEHQRRVGEALELVSLSSLAKRYPQALSGGQRQRVALARCLVTDPAAVLLDEPLANLDRHLRAAMEESFRDFHRRTRATLIYVTHDQGEAMALADRIAVLNNGRLEQWDTPETLYRRPRTPWVADFIGHGSQLSIASGTPQTHLDEVALMRGLAAPPGERYSRVLIRPEHVIILPDVTDDSLPFARVERTIFRGERYEMTLRLGDGDTLLGWHPTPLESGQRVAFRLREGWCLTT